VVDFAYHVHTDVGNQMVGAKVNGKMVPNNHELQNAEVVEILTYSKETSAQDVIRHMVRAPRPCHALGLRAGAPG
jgi:(p)ppGpp synthase/HD superfamily hydrolase